jgi:hypothetical protein
MFSLRQTFDSRFRRLKYPILADGSTVTSSLLLILAISALAGTIVISDAHFPLGAFAAQGNSISPNQVTLQTIAKGVRSGIRESLQTVARSQTEWQALWQNHASIQANQPPPPAIEFSDQIVVAVFLGDKPTGGYEISIISAEQTNGVLTVSYSEKEPRPGAITTQSFTQPFHIVRIAIPRAEKVVFRRLL